MQLLNISILTTPYARLELYGELQLLFFWHWCFILVFLCGQLKKLLASYWWAAQNIVKYKMQYAESKIAPYKYTKLATLLNNIKNGYDYLINKVTYQK